MSIAFIEESSKMSRKALKLITKIEGTDPMCLFENFASYPQILFNGMKKDNEQCQKIPKVRRRLLHEFTKTCLDITHKNTEESSTLTDRIKRKTLGRSEFRISSNVDLARFRKSGAFISKKAPGFRRKGDREKFILFKKGPGNENLAASKSRKMFHRKSFGPRGGKSLGRVVSNGNNRRQKSMNYNVVQRKRGRKKPVKALEERNADWLLDDLNRHSENLRSIF